MDEIKSKKNVLYVQTPHEKFKIQGRLCAISSYSFIPKRRYVPKERTYFNSPKMLTKPFFRYDSVFPPLFVGYNQHLHRCDRQYHKMMGLHTNKEEHTKTVPSLSSTYYGFYLNRPTADKHSREFARTMRVRTEFYRDNGVLRNEDTKC